MDPFLALIVWFILACIGVSLGWVSFLIRRYVWGIFFGIIIPVMITDPLIIAPRVIPTPVTFLDHIGPTIFVWITMIFGMMIGLIPIRVPVKQPLEIEEKPKRNPIIVLADGSHADVIGEDDPDNRLIYPVKNKHLL